MACATNQEDTTCDEDETTGCSKLRQVKLFITSYNDEFFAEREFLKKQVLPVLRSWCVNQKLELVPTFHNWGGRHSDLRDVAELERMHTSIENCYFSSVMPIFVNISSSSLGWVPLWGQYPEEVVEDFQEAYGLLYEDLEILTGAFKEENPNSLYLLRDDSFIEALAEDTKASFIQSSSASSKVCGNNDKISPKLSALRLISYSVHFKGVDPSTKKPSVTFPVNLKQKIVGFLQQRIAVDFCGQERLPLSHLDDCTNRAHLDFVHAKSSSVLGRGDIVNQIEDYVLNADRDVPLVLLGPAGAGKTSALCLAARSIIDKVGQGQLKSGESETWRVFCHLVGAVPGSTALEQMLKRLLRQTGMSKKSSNCAKDLDSAAQMCCSMLSNPNTEPLVVFLDAADQFSKEQGARSISWVPRKLSPRVRLIIAMVTDSDVHKALQKRETKSIEVTLSPLDGQSKKGIVSRTLTSELTNSQLESLVSRPMAENPLWLTLACQELQLFSNVEQMTEAIDQMPDSLLLLFDKVLHRMETGAEGDLLVGTLCLLEASAAGLNEQELRQLLADGRSIKPPSPFEEKEETESREKDVDTVERKLSESRWQMVLKTLQPYVRPYGDSRSGRLDFYHRALSKAVKTRYLSDPGDDENTEKSDKSGNYVFWHNKLAEFFRRHPDMSRMVEEYPYHLACLDDRFHLAQCLCDWKVFDLLYHEEYSSQLLTYWRKIGPISEMISSYEVALKKFEESDCVNEAAVSLRYEKVCRVTIQAGKHHDALELLKTAMKIEDKELGGRDHRMVELFALMSEIYDEKLKLNDFVSRSQLPDLRKTIHYAKKSINIRKKLRGPYHLFKLGVSMMRLAFNMKSWEASGAGTELSGPDAVSEGNRHIDRALKIFQELNDMGHYAEALMTKGVLAPRGSMEQLKLYNKAMDLCMQMYGEYHILTSRLYINIGIVYEDNKDYKKSYQYFKAWARLSEEIMGPDHPKTLRAKGVLRESRYRRIAMQLGEWVEDDDPFQEGDEDDDERSETSDIEHSLDDTVNNLLIVSQEDVGLESSQPRPEAGDQPALPQPHFNVVPLRPVGTANPRPVGTANSHPRAPPHIPSERLRTAVGDSRWRRPLRSRLERGNAIRRNLSTSDHNNLVTQLEDLHTSPPRCQDNRTDNNRSDNNRMPDWIQLLESDLRANQSRANRDNADLPDLTLSPSRALLEACFQEANRRQRALAESIPLLDEMPSNCDTQSNDVAANLEDAGQRMRRRRREVLNQGPSLGWAESEGESDSNRDAHSDSENFYDDNFEDYDEHYMAEGNESEDLVTTEMSMDDYETLVRETFIIDNRFRASSDSTLQSSDRLASNISEPRVLDSEPGYSDDIFDLN